MKRRAWLWAALALGACDPSARNGLTPFPSDGVAGFGKAALVEVCIGSARAVPGGAAALCVPSGAEPLSCVGDGECAGAERCQCGRCIVRACDEGSVCPAGEACRGGRCARSCTEDSGCAAGEVCNGGGCTRKCTADSACRRGETCDFFGVCSAQACAEASSCGSGYSCEPVALDADVREPAIVTSGDEDFLFFELRRKDGSAIYRGRFDDPLHVTADPAEPVLEPPSGETRVGAPSPLATDDRIDLFVSVGDGAALGIARSKNGGGTFSWLDSAALTPEQTWESGSVGSPGAFARDGETYVFYEGGPGRGIGLAKRSGDKLERTAKAPLLMPGALEDASFWRSVQTIGSPVAFTAGGTVRLYVAARGIEGGTAMTQSGPVPPSLNDSIGLLATTDLESFERYPTGPVLLTISGLFGSLGEREPALRLTDEGADIYFVATDASGTLSAGLSRASTVR